jgi:membrane protease YdiL (CAAX protease family)
MTRLQFLLLATVFQGGLGLLGLGLAYWQDVELAWDWNLVPVARGVLFTIPMALFLWWTVNSDWPPLKELRELLVHRFGPILRRCTWLDLVYVSVLAGCSEEVLFRGAIQNLLHGWGLPAAIIATNLLFGLCHAATTVYFVYAFLAGCYLTWVAGVPEQHLSSAIVAHAVYDLIALGVIRSLAAPQDKSTADDASEPVEESSDPTTRLPESSDL